MAHTRRAATKEKEIQTASAVPAAPKIEDSVRDSTTKLPAPAAEIQSPMSGRPAAGMEGATDRRQPRKPVPTRSTSARSYAPSEAGPKNRRSKGRPKSMKADAKAPIMATDARSAVERYREIRGHSFAAAYCEVTG